MGIERLLQLESLATIAQTKGDEARVEHLHDVMDGVWYNLDRADMDWMNRRETTPQPMISFSEEKDAITRGWHRGPRLEDPSWYFLKGKDAWWRCEGSTFTLVEDDYAEKLSAHLESR